MNELQSKLIHEIFTLYQIERLTKRYLFVQNLNSILYYIYLKIAYNYRSSLCITSFI